MRLVQELFPCTIVMDEGRVVANGLTMEILEDEELLNRTGWKRRDFLIAKYIKYIAQYS